MQHHRNGGDSPLSTPPPLVDRVCGIGLCDVLRIVIEPCQVPGLRVELRTIADSLTATIERGRADDLDRLRYARRVVGLIATQLERPDEPVVVCGPAPLLSDVIATVTGDALTELIARWDRRPGDGSALREAARTAAAWVETHTATQALESYSFDPACDPA